MSSKSQDNKRAKGQQMSFGQLEYTAKKKVTRRDKFLAQMEAVVPWAELVAVVEPHYPKGQRGRPPVGCERMLRIYFIQQWYALADEAVEDAIYDSQALRSFVGIDLSREPVPDATTLLKFRRLLETHQLAKQIFQKVNTYLQDRGLLMRHGTIMDATILNAPSSTKNKDRQRDPEMHQTKKGNQWYFGMKAHIGADADSGIVHSLSTSAANQADINQAHQLLHGKEQIVVADSAYTGVQNRKEVTAKVDPQNIHTSFKPSTLRNLSPSRRATKEQIQHLISTLRAKGEHAFLVLKHIFGHRKIRYRGLHKNDNQLHSLFALVNLYRMRTHLLR